MQQTDVYNSHKFAEKVRDLRLQQSSSLDNFVFTKGGISTATWSRVENGKNNFKLSTIIKVAGALNITVAELMKDIDFDYTLY